MQNNNLQQSKYAARQQIQQLTTQIQQAEAENKRLSASFTTLNKDKHALMTQLAATEKRNRPLLSRSKRLTLTNSRWLPDWPPRKKEKQAVLEQVKALNADKQSLTIRLAAAERRSRLPSIRSKPLTPINNLCPPGWPPRIKRRMAPLTTPLRQK